MLFDDLKTIISDNTKGELPAKLEAYFNEKKAELDTETRRKTRAFWLCIVVITAVVFYVLGAFVGI